LRLKNQEIKQTKHKMKNFMIRAYENYVGNLKNFIIWHIFPMIKRKNQIWFHLKWGTIFSKTKIWLILFNFVKNNDTKSASFFLGLDLFSEIRIVEHSDQILWISSLFLKTLLRNSEAKRINKLINWFRLRG